MEFEATALPDRPIYRYAFPLSLPLFNDHFGPGTVENKKAQLLRPDLSPEDISAHIYRIMHGGYVDLILKAGYDDNFAIAGLLFPACSVDPEIKEELDDATTTKIDKLLEFTNRINEVLLEAADEIKRDMTSFEVGLEVAKEYFEHRYDLSDIKIDREIASHRQAQEIVKLNYERFINQNDPEYLLKYVDHSAKQLRHFREAGSDILIANFDQQHSQIKKSATFGL